jgi:transcriptional regulator GlxA family with amidase domain
VARATKQVTGDIAIVGLPGSYLSSIGTLADALTLVASEVRHMFAPPYRLAMESKIVLLAPQGRTIVLAGGRSLAVDGGIDWVGPLQLVYVAAFEAEGERSLIKALMREARLLEWLRRQRSRGAVIGSSGVGNFVLAEAGLLQKSAAAPPGPLAPVFRRRYPQIHLERRARIVEHEGVLTASGLADDWTLAVRLVERCLSPHTSRWLAIATGQRVQQDSLSDDPLVAAAQFWLGERFASDFRISELARELAVSHTTLLRRFERSLHMTPRRYAQLLRIESAKKMLLTTKRPIQQVSSMVGYADTRSFRLAFAAQVGMSPTSYREVND